MRIKFHSGVCSFVWDDRLVELVDELGPVRITRASFVEPTAAGQWTADMGPVEGPVLGPYRTRGEALQAERRWLATERGL